MCTALNPEKEPQALLYRTEGVENILSMLTNSVPLTSASLNSFPGTWVLVGSKKARESSCIR